MKNATLAVFHCVFLCSVCERRKCPSLPLTTSAEALLSKALGAWSIWERTEGRRRSQSAMDASTDDCFFPNKNSIKMLWTEKCFLNASWNSSILENRKSVGFRVAVLRAVTRLSYFLSDKVVIRHRNRKRIAQSVEERPQKCNMTSSVWDFCLWPREEETGREIGTSRIYLRLNAAVHVCSGFKLIYHIRAHLLKRLSEFFHSFVAVLELECHRIWGHSIRAYWLQNLSSFIAELELIYQSVSAHRIRAYLSQYLSSKHWSLSIAEFELIYCRIRAYLSQYLSS